MQMTLVYIVVILLVLALIASRVSENLGGGPWTAALDFSGLVVVAVMLVLIVSDATKGAQRSDYTIFDNEEHEDRINNLVSMLTIAKRSVVLVSGVLFHKIYDDIRILNAFAQLPDDIRISIYLTGDQVDENTTAFLDLIKQRDINPVYLEKAIKHCLIVDETHVKIEEYTDDHEAEKKHVEYYPFHAELAQKALAKIVENIKPGQNIKTQDSSKELESA